MNAWVSGTDLVGALLRVTLGVPQPQQPEGRPGVLTRLGLMGLLDAASRRSLRRDVLAELALLLCGTGRYRDAAEELTPLRTDPWSMRSVRFSRRKTLVQSGIGRSYGRRHCARLQPDSHDGTSPPNFYSASRRRPYLNRIVELLSRETA
jgi:hypothetical protein